MAATTPVDMWGKRYCLKSQGARHPSIPKRLFSYNKWTAVELRDITDELSGMISLSLDKYASDPAWHKHTAQMNPAGQVVPMVLREFEPEFCSEGWCQMYECFKTFAIVPEHTIKSVTKSKRTKIPSFMSVHLCEAPGGAFASATNHFLSTNYPTIQLDWLGTTSNPNYEGNRIPTSTNKDVLTFSSLNNWIFLKDTTGSIATRTNFLHLVELVNRKCARLRHSVDLVTAGGSVDGQANSMEHESASVELQFTEMIAALSILGAGGSFVLKLAAFFDCQSISQLYILCALFEEVHLFKPATSHEDTSEVYVICLKYRGNHKFKNQLEILTKYVGGSILQRRAMVSKTVLFYDDFMKRILEAATFFAEYQVSAIKRYVTTWENKDGLLLATYQHELIQVRVAEGWITRCDIMSLPQGKSLIPRGQRHIFDRDPRFVIKSYDDTLMWNLTTDLSLKIKEIQRIVEYYKTFVSLSWEVSEISGSVSQLSPLMGRSYDDILSSRFCYGTLLHMRSELRAAVRPLRSVITCKTLMDERKKCVSCDPDQIRSHFSSVLSDVPESCPETDWDFSSLCFAESVGNILHYSDVQLTQKNLHEILVKISKLEVNQSLFLCGIQLLSRIQLGFVYVMNSIFQKVVICAGGNTYCPEYPQGILLHRYKGINSPQDRKMMIDLARIVIDMDKAGGTESILEIVPVNNLTELANFKDILHYNLTNTTDELSRIIAETQNVVKQPEEESGQVNVKQTSPTLSTHVLGN